MRIIRWLVLCGFLAVPVLVGLLWLDHIRETTLPTPTGRFKVGRTIYDWVDDKPHTKRELLVWMWYPVDGKSGAAVDDYVPVAVRVPTAPLGGPPILRPLTWVFTLTMRDLSKVRGHSLRDADISPAERSYPVVLMRAGGTREVHAYSALAENLASHGYVVVGLDAPYRTSRVVFPDGRVIERTPENNLDLYEGEALVGVANMLIQDWSGDMTFALDRLEGLNASDSSGRFVGRLDMQRVGAFGHSFGGAQALQFCHDDPRCKACIDVDGIPFGSAAQEGIPQPVMLLSSDHKGESGAETRQAEANFASLFSRMPPNRWSEIMIRGSNHYMFSDDAVLRSPPLVKVLRAARLVRIDGSRQLAVAAHFIRSSTCT